MIDIDKTETYGWDAAIRGMRNPMNSWDRSDSHAGTCAKVDHDCDYCAYHIGDNDHALALKLAKAGSEHAKYRRMITVTCDITAPLYWWKEAETYKVGTVCNSCSTMHTLHNMEFALDDFSYERLSPFSMRTLFKTIDALNHWRSVYIEGSECEEPGNPEIPWDTYEKGDMRAWYQMVQLLPSSYDQRRTMQFNYEVLANIYRQRKHHKLDEWREFCAWVETLPYSELITLKED